MPTAEHPPRLFRLAAVVLGVLLAVAIGEAGLRVAFPQPTGHAALTTDPELGSVLRRAFRGARSVPGIYDYAFSHDPEGFRTTPTNPSGSDAATVLLLGDSFAYGMGVEDDETIAAALAVGLRERRTPTTVLNAGHPGTGPDYALRLLQLRDWSPDVVVYLFCYNDFANLYDETYFDSDSSDALRPISPQLSLRKRTKLVLPSIPGYDFLRSHSHMASLLAWGSGFPFGRRTATAREIGLDTLAAPLDYGVPPFSTRAERYLANLKVESHRRGARFVSAFLPSAAQVAAYRRTDSISYDEAVFLQILGEIGSDGLTLSPRLAGAPIPISELYYPETHWRPVSHRIAAEALLDPIQAAICVQDLAAPGCATAPLDVRRIVAMRAGRSSSE